jgi:hypothetical protein
MTSLFSYLTLKENACRNEASLLCFSYLEFVDVPSVIKLKAKRDCKACDIFWDILLYESRSDQTG